MVPDIYPSHCRTFCAHETNSLFILFYYISPWLSFIRLMRSWWYLLSLPGIPTLQTTLSKRLSKAKFRLAVWIHPERNAHPCLRVLFVQFPFSEILWARKAVNKQFGSALFRRTIADIYAGMINSSRAWRSHLSTKPRSASFLPRCVPSPVEMRVDFSWISILNIRSRHESMLAVI